MGCFAKDTKVITKDGIKEIQEIVDVPVYVINGNGKWEETIFFECKKQRLCRINIRQKIVTKALYATKEHKWMIFGAKDYFLTSDLKSGQQLSKVVLDDESTNFVTKGEKPDTYLVTSERGCKRFEKVYSCTTSTHSFALEGQILVCDYGEDD